ncbi:hypothetical protein [Nocardioides lijunqiniae]|uniref:hypothetical protein n=1 Tax=Nocardioides lijunqiniae TaxID=2760832 RepID=UPI001D0C9043|nr:hypothetical protein [Nocardioides lijunqiniae]
MMSRSRRLVAAVSVVLAAGMLPALDASAGAVADRPTMYRALPGFSPTGDRVRIAPDKYAAVRVDLKQVRSALAQAPQAGSGGSIVFRVPTPAGGSERFAVQRTQVMESKLAAAHPELDTFAGRSLDRPRPPSRSTSPRWACTPPSAARRASAPTTSTPPTTAAAPPGTSATTAAPCPAWRTRSPSARRRPCARP